MASTDLPKDSIVEEIVAKFQERSRVGIKKYGTTLDRDDLTTVDWVNHIQEELMDAILYTQRLRKDLSFYEFGDGWSEFDDKMAPESESTKVTLPLHMIINMLRVATLILPVIKQTEEKCSSTETLDRVIGERIDKIWNNKDIALAPGEYRLVRHLIEKAKSELVKEKGDS